jgi:hypothetical protein
MRKSVISMRNLRVYASYLEPCIIKLGQDSCLGNCLDEFEIACGTRSPELKIEKSC